MTRAEDAIVRLDDGRDVRGPCQISYEGMTARYEFDDGSALLADIPTGFFCLAVHRDLLALLGSYMGRRTPGQIASSAPGFVPAETASHRYGMGSPHLPAR